MEPGKHKVTCTDVGFGKTSTGNVQIGVEFENEAGERITGYLFFSPKAMEYTEKALRTLGWDPTTHGLAYDDMLREKPIVGAQCEIVVVEEEYDGKPQVKVRWINPVGGGGGGMRDPMTLDEVSAFTASLRKRVRSGAHPVASHAASSASPAVDEDDIPF